MKQLCTIMFYGCSGSGKGTQAILLKKYLEEQDHEHKTLYLETGTALRELAETENYTSRRLRAILESGGLVPAFLPIWTWTSFLISNMAEGDHLILDGAARRSREASIIDGALKFYRRPKPFVIILNVSRELALKRLKERERRDDTDEHINRRLDWYDTEVIPAIDFFRNNTDYVILDLDGGKPAIDVHKKILQKMNLE